MTEATFCVCARLHVCLFCFAFVCFHFNLFIFNDSFLVQYLFCCFPHLQFCLLAYFSVWHVCTVCMITCLFAICFLSCRFACFLFFFTLLLVYFLFYFFQSFPCLQVFSQALFLLFPGVFVLLVHLLWAKQILQRKKEIFGQTPEVSQYTICSVAQSKTQSGFYV